MKTLKAATIWTLGLVALTGFTTFVLVVTLINPWCGLLVAATGAMVTVAGMQE